MNKNIFTLTAIIAGIIIVGIAINIMQSGNSEVKVGIGDNGSQIKLNKGQILVISLEGNPTTGYRWEVSGLDANLMRKVGETEFQPESSLIGAGGMQILRFEVVNEGQVPLKLVYHRPWEKDVEPLKTFYLQVIAG
ncbi:MAG: protease inhibitor I42 family protein [Candidatus Methanoperedens sp.]|nr:protease inhibitor I42 family protein [Candidatus Methanoperedens sp.]MCE8425638.1 protease inhibitor I42 family protein [Candidatus Methanoperedens sp.]MCE8427340.1 protease inhibitor I42 family protein [Candidatus Methanoperedens sp.]